MPSERTPLLQQTNDPVLDHATVSYTPKQAITLQHQATTILVYYRQHFTDLTPAHPEPPLRGLGDELPSLLYALYLLRPLRDTVSRSTSIRRHIHQGKLNAKVQAAICDAIEDLLDTGCSSSNDDGLEDEEEEVMVWRKWDADVNGRTASVVDLLLPPYTSPSHLSPFLSHPWIRHTLERTWYHGFPPPTQSGPQSSLQRMISLLQLAMTPYRAYILQLASYLGILTLTMSIAVRPRTRTAPIELDNVDGTGILARYSGKEVAWGIFTLGSVISTLQNPFHLHPFILLLPLHLALPTLVLDPHTTYSLICLSIPLITLRLLLPNPPSLIFLHHSLIPLSTLLTSTLSRSIRPALLLAPILLVMFTIFSWSMNGDIFRLLNVTEVEAGIAPFEARVWIFLTMIMILILGVVLVSARAGLVNRDSLSEDGRRRWKGGVREEDGWEREYGLMVGRTARRNFAIAVRNAVLNLTPLEGIQEHRDDVESGDTRYQRRWGSSNSLAVALPFNLLIAPIDMVIGIFELIRLGRLASFTSNLREFLGVCLMGFPCLLLAGLERILGGDATSTL